MARQQQRNNVLAGFFLVSALILTVLISFWIEEGFSKLPFVNQRAEYVARFTLEQGVAGLKPGSPVTLGGNEVGSVESLEYELREGAQGFEPQAVLVTIAIDEEIVLYGDASITVVQPLLGTLSTVNITDIGGGSGANPARLADGGVMQGSTSAGLIDMAGLPDLGGLADRAQTVLDDVQTILDTVGPEVGPMTADVRETLTNARGFAGVLSDNQERWVAKADSILAGADDVFRETIPTVADEVTAGVGDARRLVGGAQTMLDENRADVRRTVANLEGLSERARYDILGRMERVLDEGIIAAANMGDVGGRMLAAIDRAEPQVMRTMTNMRLASSQAVLLAEEIRAAPWRAFAEPSEKAQREEVLFGAVRRYARAVEDLRDASASLDSVLKGAQTGGREIAPEQITQMNTQLKRSFTELNQAEQALLTLIARQTGARPASASQVELPGSGG